MTTLEAYKKLLLKVNRNDSNSNIYISRGEFVLIFNEQQRNWFKEHLKSDIGSDELDQLSTTLEDDEPLTKIGVHHDHFVYQVPDSFYWFSSSYCLASRGECKKRPLIIWNTKSKNIRTLLKSENHSPSFDYEETLCSFASSEMRVYFSDFTIDEVYLSYYRLPKDIDLEGYVKLDETASKNIPCEFGDDTMEDILDLCASEIMRDNQNPEGFQFAQTRVQEDK